MKIKDNEFYRQFEILSNGQLIAVEYSYQEKKIFLTKMKIPEHFENEELINLFIEKILCISKQKKLKVVPTHPRIVSFFKENPSYIKLLATGIVL